MAEGILYKEMTMDKVIIRDLLVRGIIGINNSEREKPQDILINIEIQADLHQAGKTDDIADCVNYRTVSKKVMSHAETIGRYTVEALAEDIAKICFEDTKVVKAIVRVEKPGAARFAKSVGVEIERLRP
jgi:FolB domain-containing protein